MTSGAAPPAIRVRHLWHRFGSMDVLRDVSFEVANGEIFGFIGPNGAGKTTTIRIIATLLDPMAGRVEVGGHDVALEPEKVRRLIGYMPDHSGVYERVSVREYLQFFARATGLTDLTVVETVLELVDLQPLADRMVAALSKGMRQRLQLGRILLHDPQILVLDEPASDLDPRARIELRDLLVELRDLGKTILLSSHVLTELSEICSSVAILDGGRLLACGSVAELSRRSGSPSELAPGVDTGATQLGSAPESGADPTAVLQRIPRRMKLRVLGEANAVVPLLAGGRGILHVDPAPGGRLLVQYQGDEVFVAQVVAYLVSRGIGVVGVEPERNQLEQLFLDATRGGAE